MSKNGNNDLEDSHMKEGLMNGTSAEAHPPEMLPPSYDSIMRPPYSTAMPQPTIVTESQSSAPPYNTMPPYPTEPHAWLSQPTPGTYNPMQQPSLQSDRAMPQMSSQNYQPLSQLPYTSTYQPTTYNPTIIGQVHPANSNIIYVPNVRHTKNPTCDRKIKVAIVSISIFLIIATIVINRR